MSPNFGFFSASKFPKAASDWLLIGGYFEFSLVTMATMGIQFSICIFFLLSLLLFFFKRETEREKKDSALTAVLGKRLKIRMSRKLEGKTYVRGRISC